MKLILDGPSSDNDLGLRILAAVVSYQLGYRGVDSTLKRLRDEGKIVDQSWIDLGASLIRQILDDMRPL